MDYPKEWNVIPLAKNSKYPPIFKNWQKEKYSQEKLKEHKGNFGLVTGNLSGGLIVFDWDFRHNYNRKEKGFSEIYNEYKIKFPKLWNTRICETAHGFHLYYIIKNNRYKNTSKKNGGYKENGFINKNKVKYGKWLSALDTRANAGYVVIPPSKVNKFEYKWFNDIEPLEITKEEYEFIHQFFKETNEQQTTMRNGFVKIANGLIDIHKIKQETGLDEHVYWKEFYREAYTCCGLLPEDLLDGLEKLQPAFNREKTITQLANTENRNYILDGKRMTSELYNKYFPEDKQIKTTNLIDLELINDNKDIIKIPYDIGEIQVFNNHINYVYYYRKNIRIEKILDCSFKVFKKCYHKKEERFSFYLNNKKFYTTTILDIIYKAEPYLRKGQRGRDCLKEVISYYSTQLKYTTPKEYLGFDNGWILPQTEKEKNISIVAITDYQQEAYTKALTFIKKYSDRKKTKIKNIMKEFINITQCELINNALLIAWSIAAPFRLFFLLEYDLFPILYNYGTPNTGRSTLEDFWIMDFYKIHGDHLPPNTSIPRLEDHLSKSTFPYSLQDIKESNVNKEMISMLQDYSTNLGLFERKRGSKEVEFVKHKTAALNLDSNDILEIFSSPAINERQVFLCFKQKIRLDLKWIQLRKELKKYKLFSFMYDYTKNWKNKDIEVLFNSILEDFNKTFTTNSSRLVKSGAILRFGLDLFSKIFDISFDITNEDIMNTIIEGSKEMTKATVDQFRAFCISALNYDETTQTYKEYANGETYPQLLRGENPRYLNHALQMDSLEEYYAYTANNHEDYKQRFKEKGGMKALVEKLQKGLTINEAKLIEYISARPFQENGVRCKPMGIIRINPSFFNDTDQQMELTGLETYNKKLKKYKEERIKE